MGGGAKKPQDGGPEISWDFTFSHLTWECGMLEATAKHQHHRAPHIPTRHRAVAIPGGHRVLGMGRVTIKHGGQSASTFKRELR